MSALPLEQLRGTLQRRFPVAFRTREAVRAPEAQLAEGAVTEVIGPVGAGGTSLVLRRVAEVLAVPGRYAAFVDLGRELYPPAAAALGVPLARLLLLRPHDLGVALRAVELLLRGGAARIVAMDLPERTPPLRLSTYYRLRQHVLRSGVTLVLLARASVVPADHRISL